MTRWWPGVSVVLFGIWLFPSSVAAQDPAPLADAPNHVINALRLTDTDVIRIDGVADEPVWLRADVAANFAQRDPDNGMPATERTEVRVVFDEDRLILGITCYDSRPDHVLGNQMQRDQSFEADDRFMWTLDTFLNQRSGYFFEINPSGAMGDGLIDPAADGGFDDLGSGINRSWDGIWIARVRRTDTGWNAEVEIPFRTLNFEPTSAAWGVNFQRTIRRKNEDVLWTGHLRNQGLARMSNAGRIEGISDVSQGLGLDLRPYLVGTMSAAPGRGRPDAISQADIGGDIFYNVTPALRASVSINTDFAETEVDERRLNLTRFPLFFEEKRDFFLEGSGFFDFAREDDESVLPFFSRRIGLDERGMPQRIDVGAKLTGQAGRYDIGVLQVRTGDTDDVTGENFSVVRLRRRLFQQSYVGALYTRRSARITNDIDRHTAGIDAELQTSHFRGSQNLALSGFYVWTSQPDDVGDGAGYGLRLSYPNDPFSAELAVRELQTNYDPAVGFVERRGYKRLNPSVEYTPRLRNHPFIRGFEFSVDFDLYNDSENRPLTRELEFTPLEIDFEDGSRFGIDIVPTYERLEEDFEISDGIILPAGERYRFTRVQIGGGTADHRVVSVESDVSFGNFFSGTRREYTIEIGVRPRRGMALALEAEHNVLELAEGSFDASVYRIRANTQLSPWISMVNNVQYDSESELVGWQMRFRWIRRPGNDVYFVYTHNWREVHDERASRFITLDNRAAAKVLYTVRF